jgi:hypothetical protein
VANEFQADLKDFRIRDLGMLMQVGEGSTDGEEPNLSGPPPGHHAALQRSVAQISQDPIQLTPGHTFLELSRYQFALPFVQRLPQFVHST